MNDISLVMAAVDTIPVIFFILFYKEIVKHFNNKMNSRDFALFTSGNMLCIVGGFFKVLWKVLYALDVCDYTVMSKMFFPLMSVSYFLMAYGLNRGLKHIKANKKENTTTLNSVVPPVVVSNLPFILVTFIGTIWYYVEWVRFSIQYKSKKSIIIFILSFICVMLNSVVSSKFDNSPIMHWIAQFVNVGSLGLQYFALKTLLKDSNNLE